LTLQANQNDAAVAMGIYAVLFTDSNSFRAELVRVGLL